MTFMYECLYDGASFPIWERGSHSVRRSSGTAEVGVFHQICLAAHNTNDHSSVDCVEIRVPDRRFPERTVRCRPRPDVVLVTGKFRKTNLAKEFSSTSLPLVPRHRARS
jgi:hypothetical protein